MKIKAFMNHGRWMGKCPRCQNIHVLDGDTLVCPACWKGLKAQKFETDGYGALVAVPHVQLIFETRDKAKAAGEEYEIEYPKDKEQIMKVLRKREIHNMNWLPHETLDSLIAENAEHRLESDP